MSAGRILLAALGMALAALLVFDAREFAAVRDQWTRLSEARARVERLQAELLELNRRDRTAEQGLRPLRAHSQFGGLHNFDLEAAARNATRRLSQLKTALAHHPAAQIPELGLLSDTDWLNLAGEPRPLDTDEQQRAALGQLHDVAIFNFAREFQAALKAYLAVSGGQLPSNPVAIAPYMDGSVDSAIFARYEMLESGAASAGPRPDGGYQDGRVMAEKVSALPDPAYDNRFQINQNGLSFGAPYDRTAYQQAQAAFAAANPGRPSPQPAQLQPYFQDPAMGDLYVQYEQAGPRRLGFPIFATHSR
ncbi:MAG TPA: hypothetical protein VHV47_11580 [Opitutaceae bacterium]|jgi:hypothetical protein|nr:hypothetical protein [Opitutaceae bacterium]